MFSERLLASETSLGRKTELAFIRLPQTIYEPAITNFYAVRVQRHRILKPVNK